MSHTDGPPPGPKQGRAVLWGSLAVAAVAVAATAIHLTSAATTRDTALRQLAA